MREEYAGGVFRIVIGSRDDPDDGWFLVSGNGHMGLPQHSAGVYSDSDLIKSADLLIGGTKLPGVGASLGWDGAIRAIILENNQN